MILFYTVIVTGVLCYLAANSVNFRLYGALKPKTISCLGTPASTNSGSTDPLMVIKPQSG